MSLESCWATWLASVGEHCSTGPLVGQTVIDFSFHLACGRLQMWASLQLKPSVSACDTFVDNPLYKTIICLSQGK